LENLYELDDNDELYEGIEDLWPEFENNNDTLFFDDEDEDSYYD
jgi:hypothetical protein